VTFLKSFYVKIVCQNAKKYIFVVGGHLFLRYYSKLSLRLPLMLYNPNI